MLSRRKYIYSQLEHFALSLSSADYLLIFDEQSERRSICANFVTMSAGIVFCTLLALQFGFQPILSSTFQHPSVSRVAIVMVTEFLKVLLAVGFIFFNETPPSRKQMLASWNLKDSLEKAALPAISFSVQNLLCQFAISKLDSLAFNVINQTKTLSNAVFLYILLNQKSSMVQIIALCMLVVAATALAVGDSLSILDLPLFLSGEKKLMDGGSVDFIVLDKWGLAATLVASLLSGFSNAMTQRSFVGSSSTIVADPKSKAAIVVGPRNPFLYSIELAVYGLLFLCVKETYEYYQYDQGVFASSQNFSRGWTPYTLIPVVVNACGGIVVGLVVKYAGGIAKGFALIVGIIITGIISYLVENKPLSPNTGLAVVLVIISIYLHSSFPPTKKKEAAAAAVVKKDA